MRRNSKEAGGGERLNTSRKKTRKICPKQNESQKYFVSREGGLREWFCKNIERNPANRRVRTRGVIDAFDVKKRRFAQRHGYQNDAGE